MWKKLMRFKVLVTIVLLVIGAYVAFWFYLASQVEEKTLEAIANLQGSGVGVFYDDLEVEGFPYKIVLKSSSLKVSYGGPELAGRTVSIAFPEVAVVAQPWKLTHGVMVADYADLVVSENEEAVFRLAADHIKSSLILDIEERRPQRLSVVMDKMQWGYGPARPQERLSEARDVQIHVRRPIGESPDTDQLDMPVVGEMALRAKDIMAYEIPVGIFGKKADTVMVHAAVHGSRLPEFTPAGLAPWRDEGGTVTLQTLRIDSGKLDLTLKGDMSLDQEFRPLGAFSAEITGVEHIIEVLSGLSAFQKEPGDEILDDLKDMVEERRNGNDEMIKVLSLSIALQNGLLFVGPIPVYELSPVIR